MSLIWYEQTRNFLTSEQNEIYNYVNNQIDNDINDPIFVYASGGCGKTRLFNTLIARNLIENHKVAVVSSTGLSATLLINGRTVHNLFKVPLKQNEDSVCQIPKNSNLAKYLKSIKLIIWDEAASSNKFIFETVDRSMQDLCGNKLLFGGKLLVCGGDFRQTAPIIKHGSIESIVNSSLKNSFIWEKMKLFKLTKNLRIQNDLEAEEFSKYLLQIGDGKVPTINDYFGIKIKDQFLWPNENLNDFIESVFDSSQMYEGNHNYFENRVILSLMNEDVDDLNEIIISKFKSSQERTYLSYRELLPDSMEFDEHELCTVRQNSIPQHKLKLKVGCIVILIRNLNCESGLCNGTRIRITKLTDRLICGVIVMGKFKDKVVFIPKIYLYSDEDYPVRFKVLQFPVRLAYVLTINKSQGQDFEFVGIHLENQPFAHGQLYVAMSRVKNSKNLKIFKRNEFKFIVNKVYNELLSGF